MKVTLRNLEIGKPCPFGFIAPPRSWWDCTICEKGLLIGGWGLSPREAWKNAWESRRIVFRAIAGMEETEHAEIEAWKETLRAAGRT